MNRSTNAFVFGDLNAEICTSFLPEENFSLNLDYSWGLRFGDQIWRRVFQVPGSRLLGTCAQNSPLPKTLTLLIEVFYIGCR
jgi:hypothetical protein